MLPHSLAFCYVVAVVAVGRGNPAEAIAAIVALALANNVEFWRWASTVREFGFRGWWVRRSEGRCPDPNTAPKAAAPIPTPLRRPLPRM